MTTAPQAVNSKKAIALKSVFCALISAEALWRIMQPIKQMA